MRNLRKLDQKFANFKIRLPLTTKKGGGVLKELIEAGISSEKIVVGKPLTLKDANNGYIEVEQLAEWGCRANKEIGFIGGYMTWMFHNDNREASEVWARILNRNCEC